MAGLSCINRSSPIDTRLAAEHTSLSLSNTMREIPPLTCVKEDYANLLSSIVCFFCLNVLAVSADLVAYAANRANQRAVVSGIHFAAKIVDVDVHDVGQSVEIKFPDLLDDGGTRDGLAFVAHQEFQQSEFLGTQIDVVTSAAHGVADTVDFEVFDLENRACRPASSAEPRANAHSKFGEGERFREIVVCTGIESADALFHHAGAGHHNDRQVGPLGTNPAQDIQPAGSRQIEVQEHEVVGLVGHQSLRLRPARNHLNSELLLLQPLMQKFRKRRVIFGDKNAHRFTRTS